MLGTQQFLHQHIDRRIVRAKLRPGEQSHRQLALGAAEADVTLRFDWSMRIDQLFDHRGWSVALENGKREQSAALGGKMIAFVEENFVIGIFRSPGEGQRVEREATIRQLEVILQVTGIAKRTAE